MSNYNMITYIEIDKNSMEIKEKVETDTKTIITTTYIPRWLIEVKKESENRYVISVKDKVQDE